MGIDFPVDFENKWFNIPKIRTIIGVIWERRKSESKIPILKCGTLGVVMNAGTLINFGRKVYLKGVFTTLMSDAFKEQEKFKNSIVRAQGDIDLSNVDDIGLIDIGDYDSELKTID